MSQAFRIETLDRSGRWYLTPGARSIYDLRIRNDSKNAVACSLIVDEPAIGVSVDPAVLSLDGHEVRTVTVTFAADATAGRAHSARLTLRADDGSVLATFEHPLVVTGGTDCSIAMAYKDVIVEAGELRGFQVACSVRSQSEGTSTFQVSLSEHPALSVPALPPISLEPGQLGEMIVPIHWNRNVKDEGGWNHPLIIEAAVPVSNGRRTSRMRWEAIELQLDPFLKNGAAKMNVTVSSSAQAQAPAPVEVAPAPVKVDVAPAPVEVSTAAPSAAAPSPDVEKAAAAHPTTQPAGEPSSAPVENKTAVSTPAVEAQTVSPVPAKELAAAADSSIAATAPAPRMPAPALLMLNGHTQLLMLAAPVDVKESPRAAAVAPAATARVDGMIATAAPATNSGETIELPLFVDLGSAKPPTSPASNGKAEIAAQPPDAPAPPVAPERTTETATAAPAPAPEIPTPAQPAVSSAQPATPPTKASVPAPEATTPTPVAPEPVVQQVAQSAQPPDAAGTVSTAAPTSETHARTSEAPPSKTQAPSPSTAPVAQPSPVKPTVTWTIKTGTDEAPVKQPVTKPAAATTDSSSQVAAATTPASQHTPTSPAPTVPQAKLTPYAPARWSAESEAPVSVPEVSHPAPPPAPVVVAPVQVRTRPIPAAVVQKRGPKVPAGLVIGALAGGALLVAGLLIFKPTVTAPPSSKPVAVPAAVITPVVRVQQHAARVIHRTSHPAKPVVAVVPTQHPTATPAPAPTVKAATPKPAATPVPATPRPAAQRVVAARPAPKPVSHYARLYQPESGPVVALGSVEAYYGPRGRAVRVLWGAAEQASAVVQLVDEHGSTVSATSVRGGRSSAVLYLPRGFRGPLTVQVSSIGRMGERVATTTSLPAFGQ
ncbi:MAG: hypothetical protein JOY87_07250 [Candidatus Eremiobacteraeota bacterium]|nr:hypothetical protein [Candidatus Eremiobacteraeota bacterium]